MVTTKRCGKCGEVRQRSLFRRARNQADGRNLRCGDCLGRYQHGHDLLPRYQAFAGKCGVCDQPVSLAAVTWDHIIPRSFDGANDIDNLQPTHFSCNALKKDFPLDLARRRLAERGHVAPDEQHEHEQCNLCRKPFLCREKRGYCKVRTCDECFDQAVALGQWRSYGRTDYLEGVRLPGQSIPAVELYRTNRAGLRGACSTRSVGETLATITRMFPKRAPWIVAQGPLICSHGYAGDGARDYVLQSGASA